MKTTENIMESSVEGFLKMIFNFMGMFDDATQAAIDADMSESFMTNCELRDFINDSYLKLDQLYHKVKKSGRVSTEERNSARMLVKETYKMIVVHELYVFDNE